MKLSHVSWNLVGLTLPLGVAAIVIPPLLQNLGAQRFGILALAWGLIGYASAVDLGIGRAVTQMLAGMIDVDRRKHERAVLSVALKMTMTTGLVAFLVILALALVGAEEWLGAPEVPRGEKVMAIVLMAFALPLQSISATYRGVNEAHLNFKKISLLRIGLGVANFGAPFLISMFSVRMHWIVASLVASRAISFLCYRSFALQLLEKRRSLDSGRRARFAKIFRWRLLNFGGWITISSIINPIVNAADRFLLASLVSAAAVTVYVIPYEMTTQSLILVGAVSTVFFPYAARAARESEEKLKKDFLKLLMCATVAMGMATLAYILLGDDVLSIWLKEKSSPESVRVLQIISLGLVPYAIASISTSLIHSKGQSSSTAVVNLLMFAPSLVLMNFAIQHFGPIGAAGTWVLRILIEAICFLVIALRLLSKQASRVGFSKLMSNSSKSAA